jgi:hypothetical protein
MVGSLLFERGSLFLSARRLLLWGEGLVWRRLALLSLRAGLRFLLFAIAAHLAFGHGVVS